MDAINMAIIYRYSGFISLVVWQNKIMVCSSCCFEVFNLQFPQQDTELQRQDTIDVISGHCVTNVCRSKTENEDYRHNLLATTNNVRLRQKVVSH